MELFGEPKEPWLRTFLELPHGIPSHDTFKRLLAALDPQRFLEAFRRWTQRLRTARAGEVVAIDGRGGGRENREAGGRARGAAPRAGRRAEPQSHRQRLGPRATGSSSASARSMRKAMNRAQRDSRALFLLHKKRPARRCWQSAAIGWFADCGKWEGLRSVLRHNAGRAASKPSEKAKGAPAAHAATT